MWNQATLTPAKLLQIFTEYRYRWIVPAAAITLLALGYALTTRPVWQAQQAMLVRDEAMGSVDRPGRFETADSMKTAQETVMELCRNHAVVHAALAAAGPPSDRRQPAQWPTLKDVEKAQRRIQVTAPNGAEFGRTEMFYLKVKAEAPQRAITLTQVLGEQVETRLQQLRDRKAQSLVDELTDAVRLARSDLEIATQELAAMEQEVGSDLGELRALNESAAGESNLRQSLNQLKNELRHAQTAQQTNQQLLELLREAQRDPDHLVAMPNRLLEAQPGLRQLKDGLVNAQIAAANLLGELTEEHPKVRAARLAQQQIRGDLYGELDTAVRAAQAELRLSAEQVRSLESQLAEVHARMVTLVGLRAGYSNQVQQVRHASETLKRAQQNLASARASQASAHAARLITRLDQPITGSSPAGPRKALIVLSGLLGGLVTGLGLVLLTVPAEALQAEPSPAESPEAVVRQRAPAPDADPVRGLSLKQALTRVASSTLG